MKQHYWPRQIIAPAMSGFYRLALHPRLPIKLARRVLDLAAHLQLLPPGTVVRRMRLGGRWAERITVGATERPRAIIYLHGGGFTIGSLGTHRTAVAYLARDAGAVAYSLDYRLAPEHPYPAGLDDAVAAFVDLVQRDGLDPARIALAGDSAGGGMVVAAARRIIDEHGLRPGALALFSPWTDLTDETTRKRDLVVSSAWAKANGMIYVGSADPQLPGISPGLGDLSGLPPMWVLTTTPELLHDQVLRFVAAVRAAGGDVSLHEHPNLWHSGHTQVSIVREAGDVIQAAGAYLRNHL